MTLNPTLLVLSIAGMMLAVGVLAISMRRHPSDGASDVAEARVETLSPDRQATFLRYYCPACGHLLRQEVSLLSTQPRQPSSRATSGYPRGETVCPACGMTVRIDPGEAPE